MRKQLGPWCISFTLKSLFQDFATSQRYREIVPIFFSNIVRTYYLKKNILVIDKTFANSRLKTDILIFWDLTIRTLKGWLVH